MDYMEILHEACEATYRELEELNRKVENNGGRMTSNDVEMLQMITHSMKSIETVKAMKGAEYNRDGAKRKAKAREFAEKLSVIAEEAPTDEIKRTIMKLMEKAETM